MAPVMIWEDPVVGRCWPVDVAFNICVRLTPKDGGVLNEVAEVKDASLHIAVGDIDVAVIESGRVSVELEETRFAQDVGLLVIRMIPEPT